MHLESQFVAFREARRPSQIRLSGRESLSRILSLIIQPSCFACLSYSFFVHVTCTESGVMLEKLKLLTVRYDTAPALFRSSCDSSRRVIQHYLPARSLTQKKEPCRLNPAKAFSDVRPLPFLFFNPLTCSENLLPAHVPRQFALENRSYKAIHPRARTESARTYSSSSEHRKRNRFHLHLLSQSTEKAVATQRRSSISPHLNLLSPTSRLIPSVSSKIFASSNINYPLYSQLTILFSFGTSTSRTSENPSIHQVGGT
jgi:hypothetical protein